MKTDPYGLYLPALFELRLLELGVPAEGIRYLNLSSMCNHWMGEDADGDSERGKEITGGVAATCNVLDSSFRIFVHAWPERDRVFALVEHVSHDFTEGVTDVFDRNYPLWADPNNRSEVMQAFHRNPGGAYR